ncbi:sugar phosphate isomerase/epimerase family protein [Parapedobacter koreensis]|uniref:Xylose isomerase-like TIM barrel n=1 Tax=Parapedobacter koreensis TaxID=332977 RepID=A0A1H7GRE0_9SPHI|nr:TIM barrel protein [Parapedobacter koreensis]SEK39180.1 Xylose isomerase-like TIM barrel [Parapedobacter koreensis]
MNMRIRFTLLLLIATCVCSAAHAQPHTAGISYFCTDWGRSVPWDEFCKQVKEAGFDGVETWVPADSTTRKEMKAALTKYDLSYIFLCTGSGPDFDTYLGAYKSGLIQAAALKPVLINSHTGKDHFSFAQNEALIAVADSISRVTGIPLTHETHRGRFSFAAHVTREYLERLPYLQLTLDISHWCTVHESMLDDQPEAVALALQRTGHIHARVGHPEGPQVNDPRAPEWQDIVQRHLAWWDTIAAAHREQHKPLTITTEFGPPDYLPTLPYTRQPLADQWEINKYMLNLLKSRFGN